MTGKDLRVLLREIALVKDEYLKKHQTNVAYYAGLIAVRICPQMYDLVFMAALNHDVGKAFISDEILFKPSELTPEEWLKMKDHPKSGADFFNRRNGCQLDKENKLIIYKTILHHHERWDGKGYPSGLSGEEIPVAARIIAVADAYDAMTTDRSYRKAMGREEALRRIAAGAGAQFDPGAVGMFLKMMGNGTGGLLFKIS